MEAASVKFQVHKVGFKIASPCSDLAAAWQTTKQSISTDQHALARFTFNNFNIIECERVFERGVGKAFKEPGKCSID